MENTNGKLNSLDVQQVLSMLDSLREEKSPYRMDIDNAESITYARLNLLDTISNAYYSIPDWIDVIQSSIVENVNNRIKCGLPINDELRTLGDIPKFFSKLLYHHEDINDWFDEQSNLHDILQKHNK